MAVSLTLARMGIGFDNFDNRAQVTAFTAAIWEKTSAYLDRSCSNCVMDLRNSG